MTCRATNASCPWWTSSKPPSIPQPLSQGLDLAEDAPARRSFPGNTQEVLPIMVPKLRPTAIWSGASPRAGARAPAGALLQHRSSDQGLWTRAGCAWHFIELNMAASKVVEVERKYTPAESAALPRLASFQGVDRVGQPAHEQLDAVYFDTEGLALAAQRITLRRRSGGLDAGWHLKLPDAAGERHELAGPLKADQESVPERLRQLVRVHTRSHALVPVAHIRTSRSSTPLYTA